MKKLFALLLALTMVCALAACGEKAPAPSGSGSTADPGTSQQGGNETPSGGETNTADSVLKKYGLTENAVKPNETYSETKSAENNFGGHDVTFVMGGTNVDAKTYNTKLFHAIAAISDDGKVYSIGSEFTAGTGGDITLDTAGVEAAAVQWGYIYDGTKVMITANNTPNVVLGLSIMP